MLDLSRAEEGEPAFLVARWRLIDSSGWARGPSMMLGPRTWAAKSVTATSES